MVCGARLVTRPAGALLGLPGVLPGRSPFADWRAPGALLAGLVGADRVVAGSCVRGDTPGGRPLSMLAGEGLMMCL